MGHLTLPRGLIADLVTPFRENGEIDGRGLGSLLDRVLPHVHAVWIGSPYCGEGFNLNVGQREELLDKCLVVIRGQVPILVWVTGKTEDETKQHLLLFRKRVEARKYGGPVFWVDTPLLYHSNRGLHLHYRNLASMAPEPWLLHNDPEYIMRLGHSFKRNNIRTAIFKSLSGMDEIQGLVFLGSLDRASHYQEAVRKRPEFRIYDGDESRFLTYPSMSGLVSSGANLVPRAWRKITDASLNMTSGRQDYPDRLQQLWETGAYLQDLLQLYRSHPAPIIKAGLSKLGIIEYPRCALDSEGKEREASSIIGEMKRHGDSVL